MKRLLAAAALFGAACTIQLQEGHFFHPGPVKTESDTATWRLPAGYTAADVMLPMADGARLHAVRVAREGAVADVLYFGGDVFRTETFGAMVAAMFAEENVNVLMVDYRGYGRSEGKPTIALVQSDAVAAYDWLRAQTRLPIIVHGFSLGSFMAAHVAAQRAPEGLVLESTATSPAEWAKTQTPFFIRVNMPETMRAQDNVARVKAYRGPLLLVAGAIDKVTPVEMSRTLLEAAASADKELVVAPGANHGQAMAVPETRIKYRAFIGRVSS